MSQHIYFLGIGGTLMGSLAQLAKAMGHHVTGSDKALYPPMSDQLDQAGIEVFEGFDPAQLKPPPDLVVIGNAGLPRGHAAVEYVLDNNLPYLSGAEWLGQAVLRDRWVLAVSGTHGKSTTASMLTWILHEAGLDPGYLIGGVPTNLGRSAHLGSAPFFVVEADEYDTSYFDRRSKFVHYRPRTLIINNLEHDHADIFPDLAAIQLQFHHLLRALPGNGLLITPQHDDNVTELLAQGCWTPTLGVTTGDAAEGIGTCDKAADGSQFSVVIDGQSVGTVTWQLLGEHNVANGLAAIAAARHAGVPPDVACDALSTFTGVKRRLELIYEANGVRVYDDFAHHPTAIRTTLAGLRAAVGKEQIIAVLEPRTHTMSLGTLRDDLVQCVEPADEVLWFRGENIKWDLSQVVADCTVPSTEFTDIEALIKNLSQRGAGKRHIVIMSNGSFANIYQKLPAALATPGH